jgi:tyrosinase
MKSFFSQFTTATATLSLLVAAQVALSSPSGPSCGAPKVDDSYLSVVGVQGTGIHPRQEIRDLEKDTETWNLYIQALARFQSMSEKDKTSYYQVSGKTASH